MGPPPPLVMEQYMNLWAVTFGPKIIRSLAGSGGWDKPFSAIAHYFCSRPPDPSALPAKTCMFEVALVWEVPIGHVWADSPPTYGMDGKDPEAYVSLVNNYS